MKKDTDQSYLPYALIIILGALLYAKTIYFGLTFLDDEIWLIGQQAHLRSIKNVFKLLITIDFSGVYYRPMIALSFLIDSKFAQYYPYTFRITNILLHLFNSCLVLVLLKQFRFKSKAALSFSLIFAVHPALVQTIAWIPGRTNSLLCVFVLTAMISFMMYLNKSNSKSLMLHFISFFFALLTKETALVLPVIFTIYWALIADQTKSKRAMKLISLSWFVAVSIWFILRKVALGGEEVIYFGMINAFFINLPAVFLYFGKVFLPVNLSVLPVLRDSNLWIGVMAAVLVSILLFASKPRNNRHILFGLFWFLLFSVPAFVHSFTFPEYRLYIPMIGVFLIIYEMKVFKVLRRFSTGAVIVCVITAFFLIAINYSDTYKDRLTFWKNAAKYSPSAPMTHANLAYAYHAYEQFEKAELEFQRTLILDPRAPTINYNIGVIRFYRGDHDLARKSLWAELNNNPSFKPAEDLLKALDKISSGH